MSFFRSIAALLFRLGYLGPFVLGVADSSFLVLPFGNDLLIVAMVAQNPHGLPFYVLAAATGSTVGVVLLDLVARKLGEEGISKIAGKKRYERLKNRVGKRSGAAIVVAGLAPPPFPYTLVIATASALEYSKKRLLAFNWLTRAVRFTIIGLLAMKFGEEVTRFIKSAPFEWGVGALSVLCIVLTALSVWKWVRYR